MHSFSDLLDVQAYDPATGSFICASGHLGFVWQGETLAGVNPEIEMQIKGMLQLDLPDQSYLSFSLVADDNLLPYLQEYQRLRRISNQVPDLESSTQARMEFLQNMQEKSKDAQAPCNLRNYILVVSLKIPTKGTITPEMLADYQQYAAQTGQALTSLLGAVHRLDDREYLFFLRNLFLRKTYQEQAQLEAQFLAYDPELTLAQQVLSPSVEVVRHKNCLEIDGQLLQVFTPLEIPQEFACGQAISYLGDICTGITPLTQKFMLTVSLFYNNQLAAKSYVETKRNYTLRQTTGPLARFVPRLKQTAESFDVLINDINGGDKLVKMSWTLVAWLPPTTTYQDYLLALQEEYINPTTTAQTATAQTATRQNTTAKTLTETVALTPEELGQQTDYNSVQHSFFSYDLSQLHWEDQQLLHKVKLPSQPAPSAANYKLHSYKPNSRIPSAQAFAVKVKSYFQTIGWLLDYENQVQIPVLLNALPLNQDRKARTFLQRERTMSTTQATVCLPLFAEWKASSSPVLPLISRTGQIMSVDLFATQTNFNCCIAAQSGSGKSFLVNEMVANLLATGAQCWIIDIGRSYKKLTEVYQGEFVEFSVNADININPFSLIRNYEQDADMLFTLIQTMLSPKDLLTEYQANAVKQITKELWTKYGEQMHIDILEQALAQHEDKRLNDLAVQLYPFTSKGAYGVYFKASSRNMITMLQDLESQQQHAQKSRLVVLELEELSGRKDLQQLVLLQLIFAVNQQMIQGQKERQKVLFIDEAWDLLASKTISYFIETGYRRFRKYNGAVVTITQSIEDLYNTASGKAIAANSANYFLLAQKSETVQQLLSQEKLILDAHAIRQITSLRTRKGHYSEIFFLTDYGSGVGRLIVEPKMQLLYSTNAVDTAALTRIRELYSCNLWQAIEILLQLRNQLQQ